MLHMRGRDCVFGLGVKLWTHRIAKSGDISYTQELGNMAVARLSMCCTSQSDPGRLCQCKHQERGTGPCQWRLGVSKIDVATT